MHALVLSILLLAPGAVVERGATIALWSRDGAATTVPRQLRLDELALQTVLHGDAQLGHAAARTRGVALTRLLAMLPNDPKLDLVLLHFANGMVVPLPTKDPVALARLDPFVARQIDVGGVLLEPGRFPSLPRPPDRSDVRPHAFGGNRVLVAERWHPLVPSTAATFSPWDAVDTLVGIERVAAASYWAELEAPQASPAARRGAKRYRESCHFCHSVEGIGGRFGWDLLDPDPIYSDGWMRSFREGERPFVGGQRIKERLSSHVRFHAGVGEARAMPVLSQLQPSDIDDLWEWISALATARHGR